MDKKMKFKYFYGAEADQFSLDINNPPFSEINL